MTKIELWGEVGSVTFRGGSQVAEVLLSQKYPSGDYKALGTIYVQVSRDQAEHLTKDRETVYLKISVEDAHESDE